MRPALKGVRAAKGYVAEIWQGSRKVGAVFDWELTGFDGAWKATAPKYRLEPDFDGQEVEVQFMVIPKSQGGMGFVGVGHVLTIGERDGEVHHGATELIGSRLRSETPDLGGGSSNGRQHQPG